MVFSSSVFLFLFVPVFLGVYYLIPMGLRTGWILVASWFFYSWWRLDFLALLVLTTIWTYWIGTRIVDGRSDRTRKRWVTLAVLLNLGALAYFKYFNFGIDAANLLLTRLGAAPLSAWTVVLPVGISFYVFQATSYIVDVYRRDAPSADSFVALAAYVSLFPQLIAGPILRYKDLSYQFRSRTHSVAQFGSGARRFMLGLVKKVLVADTVALLANSAFELSAPSLADAWLGTFAFSIQLYYDFSGYSDMAIGLGRMIGFEFAENFDAPYRSRNITEFWRRWHISLSTWLRDYLYIPLGGNRKGRGRTYVNLLTVMVLGGLWHGASFTFLAWGLYHGILLAAERFLTERQRRSRTGGPDTGGRQGNRTLPMEGLLVLWTMILVSVGWVLFRAESISEAGAMLSGLIGANGIGFTHDYLWQVSGMSVAAFCIGALGLYVPTAEFFVRAAPTLGTVAVWLLFVLGVLKILADSFSPFLYFQF